MKQSVRERIFAPSREGRALDPLLPIECHRDIAAAIPPRLLRYREFENCGHGVIPDAPVKAMTWLREFITRVGPPRHAYGISDPCDAAKHCK